MEGFAGGGFRKDNDDAYYLNRLRINLKLQPTEWLKIYFQGQDARALWKNQKPPAPPFHDLMDLRLGYLELGDTEKKAVGLRIGRQDLRFGEERLVGVSDWTNTARSFDGLRATIRHPGYRLDAFAVSVVNIREGKFDKSVAGNNLYGLYGGLENLIPKSTIEPYFFWRRAPKLPTETGTRGKLGFATIGYRWVGKLPGNFDYGTEMAKQAGSLGTDNVGAWAGHWVVGYTLAHAPLKPRIFVEYNYASGDHNPKDSKRGTFDQLYPTAHDKYGLADQVGWRNIRDARSGVEFNPHPKWLTTVRYHSWWLADPHDGLYNSSGTLVVRVLNGSAGRHVGQELDLQALYSLTPQTKIAFGYAHIFPGTFLEKATPGQAYSFPYLMLSYAF